MSFTGCSVCSGEFVRDANGDPLYCPVCDAPSREQMERACREGAEGLAPHIGVTTMVVMYKLCADGSTDLVWWTRGFERDYKHAVNTVANGLREVARQWPKSINEAVRDAIDEEVLGTAAVREAPLKFLRDAPFDPVVVPPISRALKAFQVSQSQVLRELAKDPRGPLVQAQDFEPYVAMPVYGDWLGRFVAGFGWVQLGQGIAFCCNVPFVTLEVPDGE